MAHRPYYTLFCRDGITWAPQFGDYDKEVVAQEAIDSYGHIKAKDRKIVKTPTARQADINAAQAKLNGA